jgi:DNA-binding transcriptional ArsR family regulator
MKKAAPPRHVHAVRPVKAPRDEVFVRAAAVFRAAGDVSRLRLLHRLSRGESCVSELAADASTKMSTLSQQLRVLHAERVVEKRREGKHIYYRLADEHVRQLVAMVIEHAAH